MYAGCVKVALGKPQTGRVKFEILAGTGEFSLGEGKNPLGRVSLNLSHKGVLYNIDVVAIDI